MRRKQQCAEESPWRCALEATALSLSVVLIGGCATSESDVPRPEEEDKVEDAVVGAQPAQDETPAQGAPISVTVSKPVPVCGDRKVEADEQCDDGDENIEVCLYGQLACTVCDAFCQWTKGASRYCGDGRMEPCP